VTSARLYPTVKYTPGFGKTCSRVAVAGEPTAVIYPVEGSRLPGTSGVTAGESDRMKTIGETLTASL
jgi:hypothetical protein